MKLPSLGQASATALAASLSWTTTTSTAAAAMLTSCSSSSSSGSAQATQGTCPSTLSYPERISALARSILPPPRVVAATRGSGNYGESGTASFYTIDQLPAALRHPTTTAVEPLVRRDLALPDNNDNDNDKNSNFIAFTVDNVLTDDEADALAACAEAILLQNGHSRLAPGIRTPPGMRVNQAAHWYPPNDNDFLHVLFQRVQHLLPVTLPDSRGRSDMPLYPRLSQKIAQFKYDAPGDQFRRHVDGLFPGQGINAAGDGLEEWVGVVSGLSMLLYLNDADLQGGQTRVWSSRDPSQFVDVQPQKGRALFFRRGSPHAVLHAGLPVKGDVPKYMALINVAYGELKGTRPLVV